MSVEHGLAKAVTSEILQHARKGNWEAVNRQLSLVEDTTALTKFRAFAALNWKDQLEEDLNLLIVRVDTRLSALSITERVSATTGSSSSATEVPPVSAAHTPLEARLTPPTKVKINYERRDDGQKTFFKVEGHLDERVTSDLQAFVDHLIAEGRKDITLDLSGLRLINSAGVGVIVSLFKRVRAMDGNVKIEGLRDQPRAIFRLLRLDRVFPL